MAKIPKYVRNVQGHRVELTLLEVDPLKVRLDPTNPRIGFSMRQLDDAQRGEEACELLLISQEETEALKRSIVLSDGVQEPIYIRANGRVAEGNRRVVALRSALNDHPNDSRFETMPAWQIPKRTPEHVIQDLLNEIHLGAVRGWAPYEKALQIRALLGNGLIEEEVAERYRMTAREVRQQLAAVELMERLYFPITKDPTDSEHRSKFSYFFEFCKNGRIQSHCEDIPDLPERFARWVRDGRIDTGARVRRLPKILDSHEATRLLEVVGFDAAEECLARKDPQEQELYATLERARARLVAMNVPELIELAQSKERRSILRELHQELSRILRTASRVKAMP
jgi:hypothetical protein